MIHHMLSEDSKNRSTTTYDWRIYSNDSHDDGDFLVYSFIIYEYSSPQCILMTVPKLIFYND